MSREIKFRAWDGTEMYTPIIGQDGKIYRSDRDFEDGNYAPHDDLMQYTGLKDRNGKEIYEGDVLEFPEGDRHEVNYDNMVASFMLTQRKPGATYSNGFDMIDAHESQVIGNIYENPELLEARSAIVSTASPSEAETE